LENIVLNFKPSIQGNQLFLLKAGHGITASAVVLVKSNSDERELITSLRKKCICRMRKLIKNRL
jgi:hypothetical protein